LKRRGSGGKTTVPQVDGLGDPGLSALFTEAVRLQQSGQGQSAAPIFRRILRQRPRHSETQFRLGVIAHDHGDLDTAIGYLKQAVEGSPEHAGAHLRLGLALSDAGRPEEGLPIIDRAIALLPDSADAHFGRGNALAMIGRFHDAVASYNKALTLRSDFFEALANRGNALADLGRFDDAIASYDKALSQRPRAPRVLLFRAVSLAGLERWHDALTSIEAAIRFNPQLADARHQLGRVLLRLGRYGEAIHALEKACELEPGNPDLLIDLGGGYMDMKRHADALNRYERAIGLGANFPEAWCGRAMALISMGRFEEAVESCNRALTYRNNMTRALCARGIALHQLDRQIEAIASIDQALSNDPRDAEAHTAKGVVKQALAQYPAALECFTTALAIRPDFASAQLNQAWVQLVMGDYENGLRGYESRWADLQLAGGRRRFNQPRWHSTTPIAGQAILVHAEQGLGDTIQFCRYASLLAERGARVILEVQTALVPLLAGLPGVAQIVAQGSELPTFDLQCPLLSLPLEFETRIDSIPATVPYLHADAALVRQWKDRLGTTTYPRVGIVWSGNPRNINDRHRSIPLATVLRLASAEIELVALQKDLRTGDRELLERTAGVRDCSDLLTDFAQTAALVACLDLVISVDTAVAHLAGAMGKPVWVMLPTAPDWRWMLEREDSPWYPTARLFRQACRGDWSGVLQRVREQLASPVAA
jgi:tetratricopeptide (TPR) repeat protein